MSNSMDRKVVEMEFDNSRFEKNVKTSISTLDKLKASLRFDGLEKSFDDIENRSNRLDLSVMARALTAVTGKMSALEAVAFGALKRIGERAADTGIKFAKALTVDNISAGWSKFEEKTKSVGTLIAQGFDVATVNEQLDRLNWYTDETSYSFTDMVSEIAKFTATGKGLEESVDAMMGIANWAALSGQNAATASRAMYQLSQAMGSGVMRKEDYKSIQNISMDTAEFRQIALDTAVAMGTLKKNADGTYQSIAKGARETSKFNISQFADHLTQDAWFTSDVMMAVYNKYGAAVNQIYEYAENKGVTASQAIEELGPELDKFGVKAFKAAQEARSWGDTVESVKEAVASGFMTTFELLFGEYSEAVTLWTDLANKFYDFFVEPINNINDILRGGLHDSLTYADSFFGKKYGTGKGTVSGLIEQVEKFGFGSEQVNNYLGIMSNGDKKLSNILTDYIKLNKLAGDSEIVVGAASDEMLEYLSNTMKISKEDVATLKAVGDEFGYKSSKYVSALEKIFGKGKYGAYETATGFLAAAKGLDVLKKEDLDSYLTGTLKLTDSQVSELHNLADQYGANSDQVDNYIRSLKNLRNFEYGNRGWTRTAIKGLLEVTDGVGESTYKWKKGDPVSYVSELTGATEDSVSAFKDLLDTGKELEAERKELESASVLDTEAIEANKKAIEENNQQVEEWLNSITNGNEELKEQVLNIFDLNDSMSDLSGYSNIIKSINNLWDHMVSIFGAIKDGFRAAFPPKTEKDIYGLTERIREFTERLDHSEERLKRIKDVFSGFFSVFKIIGQAIKPVTIVFRTFFSEFTGAGKAIGNSAASIGERLTKLANSGKVLEKSTRFFTKIANYVKPIAKAMRQLLDFKRIGEVFKDAGGGIKGVLAVITDRIKTATNGILNFIQNLTGWDLGKVKSVYEKIVDWIENGVAKAFDKAKQAAEYLFNLLGFNGKKTDTSGINDSTEAVNSFGSAIDTVSENLGTLVSKSSGLFDKFKDIVGAVTGIFTSIKDSGIFNGFKGFFKRLASNTESFVSDESDMFNKLIEAGKVAVGFFAGKGLLDIANGIKSFGKGIKAFGDGFAANGIFGKNSIFTRKQDTVTDTIMKFAISIALLAASLWLIAKVPAERMSDVFTRLIELIVAMTVVGVIMNKTSTGKTGVAFSGFIGMAVSMLILVKAVDKLASSTNESTLWTATAIIGILMIFLSASMALMSLGGKQKGKIFGAIASIVIARVVSQLADAICKMAEHDESKVRTAGLLVMAMTAVLGAILVLINYSGGKGALRKGISFAIMAIALTIAIKALADVIAGLSKLGGKITGATIVVLGIMAVLGLLIYLASYSGAGNLLSLGAMFIMIAASVVILAHGFGLFAGVLKEFSRIAAGDFWKGLGYIAAAAAVLGLVFAVISFGAKPMLIFSAACLVFAASLVVAGIGLGLIGKGLVLLSAGLIALGTAIAVSAPLMIAGFKILANGLLDVLLEAADKIVKNLPKFIKLAVEFAAAIVKGIVDGIASSLHMIIQSLINLVIEVCVGVVDGLLENGPKLVEDLLEFVHLILKGVADHIKEIVNDIMDIIINVIRGIADKIPELVESIVYLIQQVIQGLIDAISGFSPSGLDGVLEGALKIDAILAAMGGWALLAIPASAGAAGMLVAIALLTGVLAALGAIMSIPGLDDLMNNGIELLYTCGSAISSFFNGIGDNFNVPPELATSMKNMASAILEITVASVLDGLLSLVNLGVDWDDLGNKFAKMAEALIRFQEGAVGLDAERISKITEAMVPVVEFADLLPATEGLWGFINGKTNIGEFGDQLVAFTEGLIKFAEGANNITQEHIDAMTRVPPAVEPLVELAKELPNTEGLWGWVSGKEDIGGFGAKLVEFTKGLIEFANGAMQITQEHVDAMMRVPPALDPLIVLANKLPNTEGLWGWVSGKEDIGGFGAKLVTFTIGIAAFAHSAILITDKHVDAMMMVAKATEPLVALSNDLPNTEGLWGWVSGKEDIGGFGTKLAEFAGGMKVFAAAANEITPAEFEGIEKIQQLFGPLVDLANNLPYTEGLGGWWSGAADIGDFGEDFADFGLYVAEFAKNISTVSDSQRQKMENLVPLVTSYSDLSKDILTNKSFGNLKLLGKDMYDLADWVEDALNKQWDDVDITEFDSMTDKMRSLVKLANSFKASGAFSNFAKGINDLADANVTGMTKNINDNSDAAKKAYNDFLNSVVRTIRHFYDGFYSAGEYLALGFVRGLKSNIGTKEIRQAAYKMGQAGIDSLNEVLLIESPSKAAEESGKYFGEGFVNGIDEFTGAAGEASENIADEAIDGLSRSISGFDGISDDGDMSVSIRPVMDLSEIQNGVGSISDMLDGINGYSIDGSVDTARSAARSIYGAASGDESTVNRTLDRIATGIDTLNSKFDAPVQTNNFNVSGIRNTDEVVREIRRILNIEIKKEGRKWA